ncbi:MAG TPA: F0F1 ATP synthase subunit delta [Paludibacter sp.]|nr:F0F1 ATP synthase subunit delta [Paludibacter sp.]
MNKGLISARYAKALLDFAMKNSALEQVYGEARMVEKSFNSFSTLNRALENPVLPKSEKKKIMLMAAGGSVSPTFEKFVDLLVQNGREEDLQSVALKYIDLYRKMHNIRFGKLASAMQLDEATEKRLISIVQQQTGGTIELEKIINPELVGGFTFEVDFVRWDASVASQLKQIKKEYVEINKIIV